MDIKKLYILIFVMLISLISVSASDCFNDTSLDPSDPENYYVILNASSILSEASFRINDVDIKECENNQWLLFSNESTYEVNRAKMMETLFYGSTGADPRASPTYITGINNLYSLDGRDIGKSAYYSHYHAGPTGPRSGQVYFNGAKTGTFYNNTNNYNVSSWSRVSIEGQLIAHSTQARWEIASGSTRNIATTTTTLSTEIGTDTSGDIIDNPLNCQQEAFNTVHSNTYYIQARIKTIILSASNITWVITAGPPILANEDTDFGIDNNIPSFSSMQDLLPFRITSKNIWNNETILIFNVTYNGTTYNTTIGFIELNVTRGTLVNLSITYPDYFSQSIINHNTSNDLKLNATQSQINIVGRNVLTLIPQDGLNITIVGEDSNETITNSTILSTFYLASGSYNITISHPNYGLFEDNFTVIALDNKTLTFDLAFNAIFNLIDEETLLEFNVSHADSIEFRLFCPTETIISPINTSNFIVPISCEYSKFTFFLTYEDPDYTYYRTLILAPDDSFNVDVYLIDANSTFPIFNAFILEDLLTKYDNPRLIINKIIPGGTVQITGDFPDIENKVTSFLLENNEYSFVLYSDNQPVYSIGTYTAALPGEKNLRLYDIQIPTTFLGFGNEVFYISQKDTIGSTVYATALYNDTSETTISVTWNLYEGSIGGPLIYTNTIVGEDNIYMLYDINSIYNTTTIFSEMIMVTEEDNVPYVILINEPMVIDLGISAYVSQKTINWFIIAFLIGMLLLGSQFRAGVSAIATLLMTGFFVGIGWLVPSGMSKLQVGTIIIGLMILAIVELLTKGDKQ